MPVKPTIILSLCVTLLLGCDSLEDPDDVPPDEVLKLHVEGEAELIANGEDQTLVVARIPEDAGKLDVTFTATAGTFVHTAGKKIQVYADSLSGSYRYAPAIFKSDTTSGKVYITAEVPNARQIISLTFTKP